MMTWKNTVFLVVAAVLFFTAALHVVLPQSGCSVVEGTSVDDPITVTATSKGVEAPYLRSSPHTPMTTTRKNGGDDTNGDDTKTDVSTLVVDPVGHGEEVDGTSAVQSERRQLSTSVDHLDGKTFYIKSSYTGYFWSAYDELHGGNRAIGVKHPYRNNEWTRFKFRKRSSPAGSYDIYVEGTNNRLSHWAHIVDTQDRGNDHWSYAFYVTEEPNDVGSGAVVSDNERNYVIKGTAGDYLYIEWNHLSHSPYGRSGTLINERQKTNVKLIEVPSKSGDVLGLDGKIYYVKLHSKSQYLHNDAWGDKLISVRYPTQKSEFTRFRFVYNNFDDTYSIISEGYNTHLHTDLQGDKLVSTRIDPPGDDHMRFKITALSGGGTFYQFFPAADPTQIVCVDADKDKMVKAIPNRDPNGAMYNDCIQHTYFTLEQKNNF